MSIAHTYLGIGPFRAKTKSCGCFICGHSQEEPTANNLRVPYIFALQLLKAGCYCQNIFDRELVFAGLLNGSAFCAPLRLVASIRI